MARVAGACMLTQKRCSWSQVGFVGQPGVQDRVTGKAKEMSEAREKVNAENVGRRMQSFRLGPKGADEGAKSSRAEVKRPPGLFEARTHTHTPHHTNKFPDGSATRYLETLLSDNTWYHHCSTCSFASSTSGQAT